MSTTKTPVSREDRAIISQIIDRAKELWGDRIEAPRLRNALLCAHRAKPIRLTDLLNTCNTDFTKDVFIGAYGHYRPDTDTMKDGWTAQHAEPVSEDDGLDFFKFLEFVLSLE